MLGVLSMLGLLVLIVLIVLDHAARCARTSPMMPIKNGAMSSTIDGVSSAVDRRTGRCGRARLLRPSSLGAGCYERAPHFFFFWFTCFDSETTHARVWQTLAWVVSPFERMTWLIALLIMWF
jgi:hypothetical protein